MLVSSRTTNILLMLVLAIGIAIVAMLATGVRGGPLDPTAGPGSTSGVRLPGTPISAPTTITQPGHYYLTNDIDYGGDGIAININADRVSLDLGGFHITGAASDTAVGIGTGPVSHTVIENGTIASFSTGIDTVQASFIRIQDVSVIAGSARGIAIGPSSLLQDCLVSGSGEGIVMASHRSKVSNCHVTSSSLNGVFVIGNYNVVENSSMSDWAPDLDHAGIRVFGHANVVSGNALLGNGIADLFVSGNQNRVIDNISPCDLSIRNTGGLNDFGGNGCAYVFS